MLLDKKIKLVKCAEELHYILLSVRDVTVKLKYLHLFFICYLFGM